jgi:hypothetical protein
MKTRKLQSRRKKPEEKYCLNCGQKIDDNFCSGCGQKTTTHRISFKHFLAHDLLHGAFNLDRGMLFTAKEALLQPGKAALDYISGKRVKYYNIFYFILLMIGINFFLGSLGETMPENIKYSSEADKNVSEFMTHYKQYFVFCFVPLLALNSFILFRRKKLNYSEQIIISAFVFLGVLIIFPIVDIFEFFYDSDVFFLLFVLIFCPVFMAYGYYNAFRKDYKLPGFLWRIFVLFILFCFEFFGLIFAMVSIFGAKNVNVF